MEDYLPLNWDWVRVVVVYSLTVFAVSSGILVPSLKLLNSPRLSRLPTWLRWALVLPMAFLVGQISETIPRILFATIEVAINHHLTFRPGVDCLIWQAYSPIFFVIGGMKMAPSHRFSVFVALGGLKVGVAILNIYNVVSFTNSGGEWDRLDPILNSPLWWNVPVYLLCIVLLVIIGVYLAAESKLSQVSKKYSFSLIFLYTILVLWILYYVELENIIVAFRNFRWVFKILSSKSFLLIISPSADVYYMANLLTITVPIVILLIIPLIWNREQFPDFYKRRYLWTALSILSIFLLMFILTVIIWGSCPVEIDAERNIRIRMIPFIPWPNSPFLK
jgi:hypothetical protein